MDLLTHDGVTIEGQFLRMVLFLSIQMKVTPEECLYRRVAPLGCKGRKMEELLCQWLDDGSDQRQGKAIGFRSQKCLSVPTIALQL